MTLFSFLESPDLFFATQQVAVLQSKQYPGLVVSDLARKLQNAGCQVQKIEVASLGLSVLQATLQISFLGQSYIYILSDISELKKQSKEVLSYLTQYTGPHKLMILVGQNQVLSPVAGQLFTVQDAYTYDEVKALYAHSSEAVMQKNIYFFRSVYKLKKQLTLEEIWLLTQYVHVVSSAVLEDFFSEWFSKLVIADLSLYQLSQLFLEKKSADFFAYWLSIKDKYSEIFWVTFWSDQLYRAYFYTILAKKSNPQAKTIGYGLPFSFLKTGWQKVYNKELVQALFVVTKLDRQFKRGKNSLELEQFYMNYFTHQYR